MIGILFDWGEAQMMLTSRRLFSSFSLYACRYKLCNGGFSAELRFFPRQWYPALKPQQNRHNAIRDGVFGVERQGNACRRSGNRLRDASVRNATVALLEMLCWSFICKNRRFRLFPANGFGLLKVG